MVQPAAACWRRIAQAAEPAKDPPKLPPPAERQIDFARDIQPILADRCNHCHGPDEQQGYLRLDAKAIVLRGGVSGPLFEPGKSEASLLVHRIAGLGTEKRMPLDEDPLTDEQIGLIRGWIDQGAKWPDGVGSAATEVTRHWSYVTPKVPPIPQRARCRLAPLAHRHVHPRPAGEGRPRPVAAG